MTILRPGRLLAIAALSTLGLTIGVGTAFAHVTVGPGTVVAGSYTTITFQVPNESADAETVKFTVNFPVDHPFASVSLKKEPGWTAKVTTDKLTAPISDDDNADVTQAVSSITWTADADGKIALGEFAQFDLAVGPIPKVESLAFDAVQTYDDGSVVNWDQPTPSSGDEPANPAPVLTVAPATTSVPTTRSNAVVTVSPAAAADIRSDDGTARTLGVVGIIVGALGLLVAAVAVRSRAGTKQRSAPDR